MSYSQSEPMNLPNQPLPGKILHSFHKRIAFLYIAVCMLAAFGLIAMCTFTIFGMQRAQAANLLEPSFPEAGPEISIDDISKAEINSGTSIYTFTVSLSSVSVPSVTVDYATADNSALITDNDYLENTGTITFTNPEITKTITILVNGDNKFEADESFLIILSNPKHGTLLDGTGSGTIINDDIIPSISIDDLTLAESLSGTNNLTLTVSLSHPSYEAITIDFSTADNTATTADNDYQAANGTLTFPENVITQTIGVSILGDSKFEQDEILFVNLSNPISATIIDNQGSGTILNDDSQPLISIDDVSRLEGNSGTQIFTYTISLSNPSYQAITMDFASADGTATVADGDFLATGGSVSLSENQLSAPITVTVNGDADIEPNETFFIDLTNASNATITDGQGLGTILDDDNLPGLSISDVSRFEGNFGTSEGVFTATLSQPSSQTIQVDYSTQDNTATATDNDFISANGTLTFTPGLQVLPITVTLTGDQKYELDESFAISLTNPVNVSLTDDLGIGTILNDDNPPSITIDDRSVIEGNAGNSTTVFSVTLSAPSYQVITVDYQTVDSTATVVDQDYLANNGTLAFTVGQTTQWISVTHIGDTKFELDEDFQVNLANATNASVADNQAIGSLINDDAQPHLSIDNISDFEGDTGSKVLTFTVSLSNLSYQAVGLDYVSTDGTATVVDNDYLPISGTLNIPENQFSASIPVTIYGDLTLEPDEIFSIDISNPTNATIGDPQGTGTIQNDDALPDISISDVNLIEGDSGGVTAAFTVTLSTPSQTQVSVDYSTSDGIATTTDGDYLAASGTVFFAPGVVSQPISVTVSGDTKFELDESFLVNITNPINGVPIDNQAIGTINNDDTQPQIFIDDISGLEGDNGSKVFTFTLSLSNPSYQAVGIGYASTDGTATVINNDFQPISGTLSIPEGLVSAPITVTVNGDLTVEPDEEFTIDLINPSNAALSDSQGAAKILNDDAPPTIYINDVVLSEGNSGTNTGVISVTLSTPSDQVVTVDYQTSDDIATVMNQDYLAASGTLTFTVGQTSQSITVTVIGDTQYELDETFLVNLSAPANATFSVSQGTATIVNDDPLPVQPAGLFGVELNPIDLSGGLGWITPTLTTWTKGVEIAWSDVEPNQGNRNWNSLASAVVELKNAAENNLTPIVVVGGAPEWAQKYQSPTSTFKQCGPVDAAYYDEFAAFMVDLIHYLGSQAVHVQYWEFWNQPEMPYISAPATSQSPVDGCWGEPGTLNYGGNDYAKLLKTSYSEITVIDPSAQILVGSLYLECDPSNPPVGQACESAGFINGILEEESIQGPLFNGISFQAYDFFGGAEGRYQNANWLTSWNTTGPVGIAKAQYLKLRLQAFGIAGKYLINSKNTLVDPTCSQSSPYNCPKFTLYLEETKAYYVAQSYAAAIAEGFAGNIWFDGTGTWRRNNGLLTLNQTPDPLFAYKAYDFAAQMLDGAQLVTRVTDYPAISGYEFGFASSNNHIWVIWSTSASAQLIRLPAMPNAVYDVDGTALPAVQDLTVTTMPIYLDMPAALHRLIFPMVANNYSQVSLVNGDFEQGTQGWNVIAQTLPATIVSSAPPSQPDPNIPLGTKSMLLGNPTLACNSVPANGIAAVEQILSVPQVQPQQTIILDFKYIIYSQDYGANTNYDAFEILINNATQPAFIDGNLIPQGSNPCLWNRVPSAGNPRGGITSGWAVGQVNLTQYAGQTITIRFRIINRPDTFYNTYTFLDEVKIVIQ